MFKRIVSHILAAAMVLTSVPVVAPINAFAATETDDTVLHGDVNADGAVDQKDEELLKRYIAEQNPDGFHLKNADMNDDSVADMKDLLMLKKYLAGLDTNSESKAFTVSFYDGDRLIDVLSAERNTPLGQIPSVGKSSKANAVLIGYYKDREFTEPFYAENPVTENMNVYAKYQEMESTEELNLTSFAQMNQSPDLSFEIQRFSGEIEADKAAALIIKDGSDAVELSVNDADGDGVYTVSASSGFGEGCSYELTLAEGWKFKDKEETIRTAAFSIAMEEVENIQMSDDIIYIEDTEEIDYVVGSETYEVLTSDELSENGGTFVYEDAAALHTEDILCIYVGTHPTERDTHNGREVLDPAVYVNVCGIDGTTVSFEPLGAEDQQKLYNIPDNFPIKVDEIPEEAIGSVNISALDVNMYAEMFGESEGTLDQALELIEAGDFVTLYVSEEGLTSENEVYYGRITGYDAGTGEITYEETTEQAIIESMDLYSEINLTGDDLITEEEKEELEELLLSQIEQSDFGEEAAYLLADMVTKTDGFRENMTVQDLLLTDESGEPLSEEEIQLLNLGAGFELSDDIQLSVELITSGEQLHFGDSVQLAVGVDADFEVEVEDGDKIAIELSATFVQEIAIDPAVKGNLVYKKLIIIPVPVGVKVDAIIDIKSYTALSFAAEVYTVAAEDESVWEKMQSIAKNPTEVLGIPGLPDEWKNSLQTVGDVMDKIDELKNKIAQASDTAEKLEGYSEDLKALWGVVENTGLTTEEEWEQMGETLGKTSIISDLLSLMDMTTETELSTEYLDSMQALMEKYSEMLEKETDWVKLVDQEIVTAETNVFGIAIGVEASFVVRTDMSIAIGSNLEYEIGKRYNVWFKFGRFIKPAAGSSSMDLIDEHFAFQFYVMGKIGVKAGIHAKVYAGIGTGKFASVGITTELGPYIKLYGFFVYEYTKYRPANTQDWTSKERMAGALYLEFGLYFMLGFEANAIGNLFEYSYDFVDEEIPLLYAGESRYYYDCAFEPAEDESVIIRDEDSNSENGITMTLPESLLALSYVDLNTGIMGSESLDYDRYNYMLSNPNFTFDKTTGKISVNVPENTRYMECDLTVTYLYGKLAFSQYDMSVTIPLVWTNLSTAELNEYYTVSVRVGNDQDNWKTVWSMRVLKNQEYNLPTDEEIKDMIGWNDAKYEEGSGYGNQQTTGLTLTDDMVYDYHVNYKTYSVTVENIQNADGSVSDRTYTAKYGETFDFSDLADTGIDKKGEKYTRFAGVTTDAVILVNGEEQVMDLTLPVNGKMAEVLTGGVTATANYVDDSVTAIFTFSGLKHDDVTVKLRKGEEPDLSEIEGIAWDAGLAVKDISPAIGRIRAVTTYQVICGELTGPEATIFFEENGGSDVNDITKVVGSLVGTLPVPERNGYRFDGWYTDQGTFQSKFAERKMQEGGAMLYAKWVANTYTVKFYVNGGNELSETEQSKILTYDDIYGTLPTPSRTGYSFRGWYTEADGGIEVRSDDKVNITTTQILYAHWEKLKDIPKTVFDFGDAESYIYEKTVEREAEYIFTAEEGETYTEEGFIFKYMRQGNTEYEEGLPVNAGTYNVTIVRPADNDYTKFEYTYEGVITINRALRELGVVEVEAVDVGYTFLELALVGDGGIDDLSDEAAFRYCAVEYDGQWMGNPIYSESSESRIYNLLPERTYAITVTVTGDPNYEDAASETGVLISTLEVPDMTDSWIYNDNYDISWYNDTDRSFVLSTAEELAGLSWLVGTGKDSFDGKTITLAADIDLRGHEWYEIGPTSGHPFQGVFDGGNHKISGLYRSMNTDCVGLFGYVSDTAIKNVLLDDAYISGHRYVGGIAGFTKEVTINNCVSYARVIASGNGENADVGGIVGYASAFSDFIVVKNCVNYGIVTGKANHAGGIVGYVASGTVQSNANFGAVSGVSCVAGIVGENHGKYANGNILLDALNAWVTDPDNNKAVYDSLWVAGGPAGYPVPEGIPSR